jgi:hypothetical protein
MNRFKKTILNIIDKPGLFRINKIEDIFFIITGYEIGLSLSSNSDDEFSFFKKNFAKYVNKHCGSRKNHDAFDLIRLYSGGNDAHSLKLFKNLFIDFFAEETSK